MITITEKQAISESYHGTIILRNTGVWLVGMENLFKGL